MKLSRAALGLALGALVLAAYFVGGVRAEDAPAIAKEEAPAANTTLAPPGYSFLIIREDCVDLVRSALTADVGAVKAAGFPRLLDCGLASVKKVLGYGIIAGSTLVKVPQVINIIAAGSGQSLSLGGMYLELASNIMTVVWHVWFGSPFDKYGESIIVGVGTCAVVACLWYYAFPGVGHAAAVAAGIAALAQLLLYSPDAVVAWLQANAPAALAPAVSAYLTRESLMGGLITGAGLIFSISRLAQIVAVVRAGTVGSLSGITAGMNFAGTAARVLTSSDLGNAVQMANSIAAASLNGIILVLFVLFPRKKAAPAPAPAAEEGKKEKADKPAEGKPAEGKPAAKPAAAAEAKADKVEAVASPAGGDADRKGGSSAVRHRRA